MSSPSSPEATGPRRGSPCSGSTGSIGTQAVDVLAAHPEAFRVVALATGSNRALLEQQAAQLGVTLTALGASDDGLVELATRDDVDLVVVATGGVVSLRPVLAALARRQGRGHGQQGDPGRRRTPGHARWPASSRPPAARPTGATHSPARWPGCAPSTRSTRPSGSAWSGSRWASVAALILTASGGPFLDASAAEMAAVTPGARPSPSDLDDGRQDHHRLGDARQQGPGGHRGTLAVRCRLRRDRGGHPSAERRPFGRPLRGWLPQGPAGHPGHATSRSSTP